MQAMLGIDSPCGCIARRLAGMDAGRSRRFSWDGTGTVGGCRGRDGTGIGGVVGCGSVMGKGDLKDSLRAR